MYMFSAICRTWCVLSYLSAICHTWYILVGTHVRVDVGVGVGMGYVRWGERGWGVCLCVRLCMRACLRLGVSLWVGWGAGGGKRARSRACARAHGHAYASAGLREGLCLCQPQMKKFALNLRAMQKQCATCDRMLILTESLCTQDGGSEAALITGHS
jgi:hypothetical protein